MLVILVSNVRYHELEKKSEEMKANKDEKIYDLESRIIEKEENERISTEKNTDLEENLAEMKEVANNYKESLLELQKTFSETSDRQAREISELQDQVNIIG